MALASAVCIVIVLEILILKIADTTTTNTTDTNTNTNLALHHQVMTLGRVKFRVAIDEPRLHFHHQEQGQGPASWLCLGQGF